MTRMLDLEGTRSRVDGLVHLETQGASVGLDLTVDSVYRLTGPGSLDFGGSEEEEAEVEKVEAQLRSDDDQYGWWKLPAGSYRVRYNESVDPGEGRLAHVFPLERLLRAGASHAAFLVDGPREPLEALLSVGEPGVLLKENCRISRIVVLER